MTEPVVLRDGSRAVVRPVEPGDRELIRHVFSNLSPTSRYRRFLSDADELSDEDLAYLADVDHHRHEALLALDEETGEALGVARFTRVPGDRDAAEVSVAVVDARQGLGIGTALLEALSARAREEGIGRYVALVSEDNEQMVAALEGVGARRGGEAPAPGAAEYELPVPDVGIGELRDALRTAGEQSRPAG